MPKFTSQIREEKEKTRTYASFILLTQLVVVVLWSTISSGFGVSTQDMVGYLNNKHYMLWS